MRYRFFGIVVPFLTTLAFASVTVSSPTNGSTTSTSLSVVSTSSSSAAVTKTIVYVDNKQVYSTGSGTVNTSVTVASGSHNLVVQSWDSAGTVLKSSSIGFTAASGIPSNATKFTNIHQMSNWDSCDACAGKAGQGASAVYSMTQNITSPALTSGAAKLYLQPSTKYANALWWKQLGGNSKLSNFQYDLYFYLKNPSAAQALEFDMNQSFDGNKFIFGTQCDIKGAHVWDVYDGYNHKWMPTSIACSVPAAYTWNHLVLEFQRVNGQMKFVSITLNGKKSYFNRTYNPATSSANELNVAVQLDGNGQATAYSQYIDKVNMYAW